MTSAQQEQGVIALYQLPPAWRQLPSLGHFCLKLETYLRMAGLPYRNELGLPPQAPKGKVPWIEDDGTLVADSNAIIDHLKAKYGDPLDARLTPLARAQGLALRRMVEEHTYFAVLWLRWAGETSWPFMSEYLQELVPVPNAEEIVQQVRRDMLDSIRSQGIGRHAPAEILELAKQDLSAFSTLLGEQSYFLGDAPTSFDCSVYGVVAQVLFSPWQAADKAHLQSLPNLVAFCERIRERCWADWNAEV